MVINVFYIILYCCNIAKTFLWLDDISLLLLHFVLQKHINILEALYQKQL